MYTLRLTTIYVNDRHIKKLRTLAESKGLKTAQLVGYAIADYLRRNPKP